jgi:hypothetical protein
MGHVGETAINGMVFDGRTAALALATGLGQFAVHVDQANGTGALVQVIHILRAEKEAAAELRFELRHRDVRGIRQGDLPCFATIGVELPDDLRIALPSLGRTDFLDIVPGPEAVRGAESGQSTFRTDTRASENEDTVFGSYGNACHCLASIKLQLKVKVLRE